MGKTAILLRPFHLSFPSTGENHRLTREKKFTPNRNKETGAWAPTEVELTDEEAEHPYIKEHFADGCIERPEVTAARLKAAEEKRQQRATDDAKELRKAEDALRRATGAHDVHKSQSEKAANDLNTPVNKLGAARGAGVDTPINETDLNAALNTPVNDLQAGKVKSK